MAKISAVLVERHTQRLPMNKLSMWFDEGAHYSGYKPTDVITVGYLDYEHDEDGKPCYAVCNSEYFAVSNLVNAIRAFEERFANDPFQFSSIKGSLSDFAEKE